MTRKGANVFPDLVPPVEYAWAEPAHRRCLRDYPICSLAAGVCCGTVTALAVTIIVSLIG